MENDKNIVDNVKMTERNFIEVLRRLLNLKADTDVEGTIELIKSNVNFQSANAWTLVFAIFIASVGLNTNSSAVIIGAMLISPLMGPIVGVGFALGTYDYQLLKNCARNLAIAVAISIFTSTFYFLLSPMSEIQSELLARTKPSFFDVMIAFFGGAAGIVAISRKERGNAVPGVAIATALMPPLCTAGFGLATGNLAFFFGALYLFIINSVFIAVSTLVFVRYLEFHKSRLVTHSYKAFVNKIVAYVAVAVVIPSVFMAWYLQQESSFFSNVDMYIKKEFRNNGLVVLDKEVSYDIRKPSIKLLVLSEHIEKSKVDALKRQAEFYALKPKWIQVVSSSSEKDYKTKVDNSTTENFLKKVQVDLSRKERMLAEIRERTKLMESITIEMQILFDSINNVMLEKNYSQNDDVKMDETHILEKNDANRFEVVVSWKKKPRDSDRQKVSALLRQRLGEEYTCCRHLLLIKDDMN